MRDGDVDADPLELNLLDEQKPISSPPLPSFPRASLITVHGPRRTSHPNSIVSREGRRVNPAGGIYRHVEASYEVSLNRCAWAYQLKHLLIWGAPEPRNTCLIISNIRRENSYSRKSGQPKVFIRPKLTGENQNSLTPVCKCNSHMDSRKRQFWVSAAIVHANPTHGNMYPSTRHARSLTKDCEACHRKGPQAAAHKPIHSVHPFGSNVPRPARNASR